MTKQSSGGSLQGINALKNGVLIGKTRIYSDAGTPNGTYVAVTIGDLYVDTTNCILYIATATGSSSWKPVYNGSGAGGFGATANVSDGGTVTHGYTSTPTAVIVEGTVAGQTVTVSSIGATTFTVAIKTNLGAAGTAQTLYWLALP